jgi:hypothetical protein
VETAVSIDLIAAVVLTAAVDTAAQDPKEEILIDNKKARDFLELLNCVTIIKIIIT